LAFDKTRFAIGIGFSHERGIGFIKRGDLKKIKKYLNYKSKKLIIHIKNIRYLMQKKLQLKLKC
jgi:hypothetical protein